MPEVPVFGRRNARERVAMRPAGLATPSPAADSGDLAEKSSAWRLAGDLVAFTGVLIAFLAATMWPEDPFDLSGLRGAIYVPSSLSHLLIFDSPAAYTIHPDVGTTVILDAGGTLPAMALLGIAAIVRRRWMLAGLVCIFFLFPWGSIGYRLPMSPVVVCVMVGLAVFRLYRFSARAMLAISAVTAVAGWLIIPLVLGIFFALLGDEGDQKAEYRNIRYASLIENEGKPPTDLVDGRKTLRVSTLVPNMKEEKSGAAAYVAAQEQALRGDARGARTALEELAARGFSGNALDNDRIRAIERFAMASGAYGTEREQEVQSHYRRDLLFAWAILIVGAVAGLLGLGFDLLAEQVRKRMGRLEELRGRLTGSPPAPAVLSSRLGTELQSIAALDGDAIVAVMSTRIRFYRIAAAGLLAASLAAAAASWVSILPPPDQNTAFETIGIVPSALDFARGAGLVPPRDPAPPSLIWMFLDPLTLSVLGLLALVVFRRAVRAVLVVLIVGLVGFQLQFFIPAGDPSHVVEARVLSPETRARVEVAMAGGDVADAASERGVGPLSPSAAALILAQLAYVEGRADDAARAMERISDLPASDLRGRQGDSYRQRMGLIGEWLATRGILGLTAHPAELSPAWTRTFNAWMTAAAAASFALVAVLMGLALYAGGRRATVQSLIDERRSVLFRTGVD